MDMLRTIPAGVRILALGIALAFAPAAVWAQSGEDPPKLAQSTYNKLTDAREKMEESQYDAAISDMQALLDELEDRDYDRAITLQTMGYAYLGKSDYDAGIASFEQALALEALPTEAQLGAQHALARLYAAEARYAEARDALTTWMDTEGAEPAADDYALLGNIHAQLGEHGAGITAMRKAIELEDAPKESYYQLLLALCFEGERFGEAAQVLERMVRHWPGNAGYWRQLASVYMNLGRDTEAHATLRIAHRKGLLESERELLNLVQLAFAIDLPDHAARVLEEEMAAGRISRSQRNLEMLAEAWASAKQYDEAIAAYQRLAESTGSGKYLLSQAYLHMQRDDWAAVAESAEAAVGAGGLDSPGRAWMLLGMARIRQEQPDAGLEAMTRAAEYRDTAQQARQWIAHVKRQQRDAGS